MQRERPAGFSMICDEPHTTSTADQSDLGWVIPTSLGMRPLSFQFEIHAHISVLAYKYIWLAGKWLREGKPACGKLPQAAPVIEAWELAKDPLQAAILKAALFATDADARLVARGLSLEEAVVRAFNDLFFNVIDRKDDLLYRAAVVATGQGRSRAFHERLRGNGGRPNLLEIAHHGPLQDVLETAGVLPEPDDRKRRRMRRSMLQAAEHECSGSAVFKPSRPSSVVQLGLKTVCDLNPPDQPAATGSLEDPFLTQLLADSDDYNDSLRIKGEAAEAGRLSKIETRP